MTFQRIEKGTSRARIPSDSVRVNGRRMSIPLELQKRNHFGKHVEIYFDYHKKLVGLKPTTNGLTGYSLVQNSKDNNHVYLACKDLARIPKGIYKLQYDMINDIYYFVVEEIAK